MAHGVERSTKNNDDNTATNALLVGSRFNRPAGRDPPRPQTTMPPSLSPLARSLAPQYASRPNRQKHHCISLHLHFSDFKRSGVAAKFFTEWPKFGVIGEALEDDDFNIS